MVTTEVTNKKYQTKAHVSNAWFGASQDFPLQYGLWLTFVLSDGREHTTAAITVCLQHGWGAIEKVQIAGSMFLRIARLLFKSKALSVDALVGKAALLDLYGGNCLRDFDIIPD